MEKLIFSNIKKGLRKVR